MLSDKLTFEMLTEADLTFDKFLQGTIDLGYAFRMIWAHEAPDADTGDTLIWQFWGCSKSNTFFVIAHPQKHCDVWSLFSPEPPGISLHLLELSAPYVLSDRDDISPVDSGALH